MKNITMFIISIGLLISQFVSAEECPPTAAHIEKAINGHIQKIRAIEYCEARSIRSEDEIIVALYTAEGECRNNKKSPPGTCSNNWSRYMIGSIKGRIIGPVKIGGKGDLSDNAIRLKGNNVEIDGLTIGPKDALCCPSIPKKKKFLISVNGFKEIKP